MNDATNGILNTTLTRDYVCDKCAGVLVERVIAGRFTVLCPKGCAAPFATRRAVEKRRSAEIERAGRLENKWRQFPYGSQAAAALSLFAPDAPKEKTPTTLPRRSLTYVVPTSQRLSMTTLEIPDKTITQTASAELLSLPAELRDAEALVANLTVDLRQAKSDLASAELDAQINAAPQGKNAEARKLELEAAVNASPAVTAARERLQLLESQVATAEVDQTHLARRFRAALALAELQTAKIGYLTTFNKPGASSARN